MQMYANNLGGKFARNERESSFNGNRQVSDRYYDRVGWHELANAIKMFYVELWLCELVTIKS